MEAFLERHAERGWKSLEDFRGLLRDRVVAQSKIARPDAAGYHGGHEAAEGLRGSRRGARDRRMTPLFSR